MGFIDGISASFRSQKILNSKDICELTYFMLQQLQLNDYCKKVFIDNKGYQDDYFDYKNKYININFSYIKTMSLNYGINIINLELIDSAFHEINHVVQFARMEQLAGKALTCKDKMIFDNINLVNSEVPYRIYEKFHNSLMMEHDSIIESSRNCLFFIKEIFPSIDEETLYMYNFFISFYFICAYSKLKLSLFSAKEKNTSFPYENHQTIFNDKLLKKIYGDKPYTLLEDYPKIYPFNELEALEFGLPLQKETKEYIWNIYRKKEQTTNIFEDLKRIRQK